MLLFFVSLLPLNSLAQIKTTNDLEKALDYAKENRGELVLVLNHYKKTPKDSLKYKAACFLIENMQYHYTYSSEKLTTYYNAIDSINIKNGNVKQCIQAYNDLYDRLGNPNLDLKIVEDTESLKSDYLIRNIDHAYRQWKEEFWSLHLSFDDFCEYLLPYRVGEEKVEEWREELEKRYLSRILWLQEQDDKKGSAYWAALYMNDQIKNRGFYIKSVLPESPVELPYSALKNIRMGTCDDYARYTSYVMRACGIPVGIDFTPQWPFRSSSHAWNVLLENSGKNIPFMGGESNPGYPNKPGYKMAKVFRKTFAYQKGSLYALKGDENIPGTLNSPFIKDVSSDYFKGVDVDLHIEKRTKTNTSFLYLAVFDNQQWIPVDWSKITTNNHARFSCMGKNIVYLPVYYIKNQLIPAGNPFILSLDGKIRFLTPNMRQKGIVKLDRKFPVFGGVLGYSRRLMGGSFEASNDSTFHQNVFIGVIDRNPMMRYDSLQTASLPQKFRYWRYIYPEKSLCNIAEIEFISDNKVVPDGKIISSRPLLSNKNEMNAFDGDGLTFYEVAEQSKGWIGLDFGKEVKIEKIKYLPRNDDNNISIGNSYTLYYWNNDNWQSLGTVTAANYTLEFGSVPTGALLLLKNHTRGTEERIFTYENGKQVWW